MKQPTPEMIEAGRMVLLDATGAGHRPGLIEAMYNAMREAEVPDMTHTPDELVEAAEAFVRARFDAIGKGSAKTADRVTPGQITDAALSEVSAFRRFQAALALPRRTEAELLAQGAADERERLAIRADADNATVTCVECDFNGVDGGATIHSQPLADWLRNQGGE